MTDDGYTWRDHILTAQFRIEDAEIEDAFETVDVQVIRDSLIKARASLTRAIALLPAPKDDDAA